MGHVYLLTAGSGEDGDDWCVLAIYSTHRVALKAKRHYERPRFLPGGKTFTTKAKIEKWPIDSLTLLEEG